MRKTTLVIGFALFTFWVGFSLGYHRGVSNEQQAWFSTAQIERTDRRDNKIVYNYPHSRMGVSLPRWAAVNRADPRSYEKYGLEP